jgi:uncharacterized membrane protein YphA (DoxX/SURF4 family)
MKKNMNMVDRVIRIVLALIAAVLIALGVITGPFAVVLAVFAVIFLITSFFAVCPIYTIMGISTKRR